VAGIGNIFLGDDAFGVHVVQRLAQCALPEGVRVADFGIRGLDLAYALTEDYALFILVDITPRGGAPGTLYLIEPDLDNAGNSDPTTALDAHSMDPVKVLRVAALLGGKPKRLLLLGCEPQECGTDEQMGLSAPVESALDDAVGMIQRLIHEYGIQSKTK